MKATITKVDPIRRGWKGKAYRLVCFKLEQGGSAVSFISEDMKNYGKWASLLEAGNVLDGLVFLPAEKPTIDADKSNPTLVSKPEKQEELF